MNIVIKEENDNALGKSFDINMNNIDRADKTLPYEYIAVRVTNNEKLFQDLKAVITKYYPTGE